MESLVGRVDPLQGDGNAPCGPGSTLAVGRLCIIATGLTTGTSVLSSPAVPAQITAITQGQFNSVQAIAATNYPSFTLPAITLGNVPGTPPTAIPYTPPVVARGITPVDTPAAYLAAADQAFATNAALQTPQYAGLNPTTAFDGPASGALTGTAGQDAFLYYNYLVDGSVLLPGYAVGFVKLNENMSPVPQDRVYMNYSYFNNANFFPTRADVNRWVPGVEKTFFDDWTSVELRTPFAATLDSQQVLSPSTGLSTFRDIEFGNMSVIFRTLVWETNSWAITTGVQTMVPTAANSVVMGTNQFAQPIEQVFVANQSVHVMPFVGSVWAPDERRFAQVLLQIDRDVNGNTVYVNNNQQVGISGRQLDRAGKIFYPTFMYLSFAAGYWLHRDDSMRFSGFSPVVELHVNQAFEEFEPLCYQTWQFGQNPGLLSVTNGLVGCNMEWGAGRSVLSLGYVMPLFAGPDRFFDGELRAMFNYRYGRQSRLTRAQF